MPVPTSEGGDPANGVVLLIDEIDKADASVPNGLLECLGQAPVPVPTSRAALSGRGQRW